MATALMGQKNIKPPKIPPGVLARMEIPYVKQGGERQKLDLYLPGGERKALLPVIVSIHGGGWRAGSKYRCYPLSKGFVQKGYAVASVGYRLSGQVKFPAQLEDIKAAVRWLRAHAGEYGLDPERIAVFGTSAGGHLAVFMGVSNGNPSYDVGENLEFSSSVRAVVDFFGPTDLTDLSVARENPRFLAPDSSQAQLIGGDLLENQEKAKAASPIYFVSKDSAPVLIFHGDKDQSVPLSQSERLDAAYKKAGAISEYHFMAGARHGGPHFYKQETVDIIDAFLRKYLDLPPQKER